MSLESVYLPSQNEDRANKHELRVITLHSEEKNHILMPHNKRLPRDSMRPGESFESTAKRIAREVFNLDGLKSVLQLHHDLGVSAHVVEAAHGIKTDLRRSFAGRAIDLSVFMNDNAADTYDPSDIELLRILAQRKNLA